MSRNNHSKREKNFRRCHLYITGRVQGVFFRYETQALAQALGVKGFVSNLLDGRVEAVFEGPAEAVDKMVKFCHKGPRGARVEEVEIYEEEPQDEFDDFRIKY